MTTMSVDFGKNGFVRLDGKVRRIVAHYKDGSKKEFSVAEFLTLRFKANIKYIDCYE